MSQANYKFLSEDLNDAGSNVLNSILDSRIEQVDAITLPIDVHRKDIVHAIQQIESYPKRLSSFLDYLIDYTYHLNLELSQKQDQLNEALDELSLLRKKSQKTKTINRNLTAKPKNMANNNEDFQIEDSLNLLKKNQKNHEKSLDEDDYALSLKILKAKEGSLHQNLNLIIEENRKLHKINSELTSKVEAKTIFYDDNFDDSLDSDKKVDITELKDQFNQIETDLIKLRQQVQNKFSVIHPKQ